MQEKGYSGSVRHATDAHSTFFLVGSKFSCKTAVFNILFETLPDNVS